MRVENLELVGIYFSKWDIPKTLWNSRNKFDSIQHWFIPLPIPIKVTEVADIIEK